MKKLLILVVAFVGVFAVSARTAMAAKPTASCTTIQSGNIMNSEGEVITTGYDSWGYNYQANMFNGGYCDSYRDALWCQDYKDVNLIMKWNNAWLSNQDCDGDDLLDRHYGYTSYIGSGAWLTNHQSGTYEGTEYDWDISGDWIISVNGGAYLHDYTFVMTSLSDGTFTGVGGYPAGSLDYTFDEIIIDGQITGDNVYFTASYYVNGIPTGYSWSATGVIDSSGAMSGTGTSGVSTWQSTLGIASKVYEMCVWSDFVKIVAAPADATSTGGYWYTADGAIIGHSIWGEFALIQEVYNDPCGGSEGLYYRGETPVGFGFYKPSVIE
ncbi:MAG: hypothetical protein WC243_02490 [Patescibacteria group bacterium]|jgi:hypothetical protein